MYTPNDPLRTKLNLGQSRHYYLSSEERSPSQDASPHLKVADTYKSILPGDLNKVKVVVRIRPFTADEERPLPPVIETVDDRTVIVRDNEHGQRQESLKFTAHYVQDDSLAIEQTNSDKNDSQNAMFEVLGVPCIEHALDGLNTTILAYGHTGSGKTYTMLGDSSYQGRGIMPRLSSELMTRIAEKREQGEDIKAEVCYFEIYNERIRDLLVADKSPEEKQSEPEISVKGRTSMTRTGSLGDLKQARGSKQGLGLKHVPSSGSLSDFKRGSPTQLVQQSPPKEVLGVQRGSKRMPNWKSFQAAQTDFAKEQQYLKVREHPVNGPYVEGLMWKNVETWMDIKTFLKYGSALRTTHTTDANAHSSRSHALFTIRITKTERTSEITITDTCNINLVDLAGSERPSDLLTVETATRGEESRAINLSLTMLNEVILSLSKGTHPSYRSSVLTWLLRDSLGGNNKTFMVANISATEHDLRETLSTLRYAVQATTIQGDTQGGDRDPRNNLIYKLKQELILLRRATTTALSDRAQEASISWGVQKAPLLPKRLDVDTQTPKITFSRDEEQESYKGQGFDETLQLVQSEPIKGPKRGSKVEPSTTGVNQGWNFKHIESKLLHQKMFTTLASVFCSWWLFSKLIKRIPAQETLPNLNVRKAIKPRRTIDLKGETHLDSPVISLRELTHSGVESISFESATPFFIEIQMAKYSLRVRLTYGTPTGTCRVTSQTPGKWRVHFLKAGVNSFGFGDDIQCLTEDCIEPQSMIVYMPANKCVDEKGFVVIKMLSMAQAQLNGNEMLHPMELHNGDQLSLQNLQIQRSTSTLYFFDLQRLD
ncbi:uncharacterized protein [Physcomitrium patens]